MDPTLNDVLKAVKQLERESIESRNMSIKTETTLQNLHATLKRVVDQQLRSARSTRIHSIAVYLVFIMIIGGAAAGAIYFYGSTLKEENRQLGERITAQEEELSRLKVARQTSEAAEVQMWNLYQSLQQGAIDDALSAYERLARRDQSKTALALLDIRMAEVKRQQAEQRHLEAMRLYRIGNYANAVREWDAALALCPEFKHRNDAMYFRGLSQFKAKQYKEAMTSLEEALALDPTHVEAREARLVIGQCMEFGGNIEAAITHYQELLDTSGYQFYRRRLLERIAVLTKKMKKASQSPE